MDLFTFLNTVAVELFRVDSQGNRIRRWMWTHESPQDELMHEAPNYLFGTTPANFVGSSGYDLVRDRIRSLFTEGGVPQEIENAILGLDVALNDANMRLSALVLMVDAHFDPGVKTDDDGHAGASSH